MDTDEKKLLALDKENLRLVKECRELLSDISKINKILSKKENNGKK